MTFTLPLTSWLGDGQLDGRAAGVRAQAERRGGSIQAASTIWDLMIMNAIRAGACTKQETKPRCGVHHLLPFTCPRSMEATRCCSHPENLSVRPAGRGSKQEKERTSKKSSNTTGTISLPSLAHTRLCHRRCPQSVPQCPAAAARLLGFLQQGLTGRNLTVMQRLNATALPIPAGLLTAVPCCAFLGLPCCWKRQLSVQPQLSKIAIMVIIMPQSKHR